MPVEFLSMIMKSVLEEPGETDVYYQALKSLMMNKLKNSTMTSTFKTKMKHLELGNDISSSNITLRLKITTSEIQEMETELL